jgi:hypothetical protein
MLLLVSVVVAKSHKKMGQMLLLLASALRPQS